MTINCISCGHLISLGDSYDDYDGRARCWVCGALLEVKTEEGNVKMIKIAGAETVPRSSPEAVFEQAT